MTFSLKRHCGGVYSHPVTCNGALNLASRGGGVIVAWEELKSPGGISTLVWRLAPSRGLKT